MNFHLLVKTRVDLAVLFAKMGYTNGAEIGVCRGKFSKVLCRVNPGLHLNCIDTWAIDNNDPHDYGDVHDQHYADAQHRLAEYNVTFYKMTSAEAVLLFEDRSLDFVYIDANHSYAYAKQDLEIWSPKIRIGGMVSGHDYWNGFGVIQAVDEHIKEHKIEDAYITEEKPHSFWWFQNE